MIEHIWGLLTFKPIATISSLLFYVFLLLLLHPRFSRGADRILVHPISGKHSYLAGFDTFRGLAATLVAVGHARGFTYPVLAQTQVAYPWLGYAAKAVPMFCVLSGFLIYRSLLGLTSIDDLRLYFTRRFLRVYPLYLLCVLLFIALGLTTYPGISRLAFTVSEIFMLRIFFFPMFAMPPA